MTTHGSTPLEGALTVPLETRGPAGHTGPHEAGFGAGSRSRSKRWVQATAFLGVSVASRDRAGQWRGQGRRGWLSDLHGLWALEWSPARQLALE